MILVLDVVVALGYLICFILILIKQFQTAGVIHGIIGIVTCGIWTFVWGWRNADKPGTRNVMLIWTLLFLMCLVLNFVFSAALTRLVWSDG